MEVPPTTPQLPSRRPLFPPVTLSEDDAACFKTAARALLTRTLNDFDAYAQTPERRVDPARWRVLRTRENLTVYREREARNWQAPAVDPSAAAPSKEATPRGNSRSNASSWSSSASSGRPQGSSDSYYNHSNSKRSGSTSSSSSSISPSSSSSSSLSNSRRAAASVPPPSPHVTTTGSTSSTRGVTPPTPYQQQARLASRSYQLPADAFDADGKSLASSVGMDNGTSTLPRLLSVGSVLGSLDDVMYGVAASDCAAIFLKAAYAHDDLVDADVLYKLEGPSPRDPFRFFGIKWLVKATKGSGVNKFVAPRDLVYVEATGVLIRPARDVDAGPNDYDRIGFQVMMSVQLPMCGELRDSHGIVRARTESCYLFKAQRPKSSANSTDAGKAAPAASCEVYATSWVDPRGRVSESVALNSVSNTLLYVGSAVQCGQRKKLAWRLANDTHGGNVIMQMNDERAPPARACGICGKSFKSGLLHKRRHALECKLCFKAMCTRCSVTQTIYFADTSPRHRKRCKEVTPKEVELCKSCITSTAQASALEIARAEVMSGRFGRVLRHDRHPPSKSSEREKAGESAASTSAKGNVRSGAREPVKLKLTEDPDATKKMISISSRGYHSHRPAHQPDAPASTLNRNYTSQNNQSRPRDDPAASAALNQSYTSHNSSEQELAAPNRSLGSSHGPPVVLLEPGQLADDLSSSRREKQSNSVTSRASSKSSKSSSSSSDRGGVYDSEIEDDFDNVDEVLETANMKHVPHSSMFKNELFMQMAELRSVAEDVYQYTRTNTAVHLTATSGSARAVRNSKVSFDD